MGGSPAWPRVRPKWHIALSLFCTFWRSLSNLQPSSPQSRGPQKTCHPVLSKSPPGLGVSPAMPGTSLPVDTKETWKFPSPSASHSGEGGPG